MYVVWLGMCRPNSMPLDLVVVCVDTFLGNGHTTTVMSRVTAAGARPLFASKLAYNALQIESGEESEGDLEEEVQADSR